MLRKQNYGNSLAFGVGDFGIGKYKSRVNGVQTKEYKLWGAMLQRCYSVVEIEKHNTYIGCEVSENFKNFQYFAEWCQHQVGFNVEGYQLDKDILIKLNKLYSEDNCVFVPKELNKFLTKRNACRGDYPIGVSFHKHSGKFMSGLNKNTKRVVNLGYFNTVEEAFQSYKSAKESYAKELAAQYDGKVDARVIEALNNYTVDRGD